MTPRAALFVSVFVSASAIGCDSASVYEDCTREPKMSGEERCVPSTFNTEDPRARQSFGVASIDTEPQENVRVMMNGAWTKTDVGGFYRFPDTPFRYDVAARLDPDVVAFAGAANRFLDLAVERAAPMRGFTAKVAVEVPSSPHPGNRLAFFASGRGVVGVSGTVETGLEVRTTAYENDDVTIHVVEYPEAEGLTAAVAKGSSLVRVRADQTATTRVLLVPVVETNTSMFAARADAPSDFPLGDVEVILDFGTRYSEAVALTVPAGTKFNWPVMPGANWTARAVSTRADGAVASIGRRPFLFAETIELVLFAPPTADRNDGDVLWATSAQGVGVFEHTLVPLNPATGGGSTIHLFSATQFAKVPDLQPLGLPPARGEYRWTVRVFPDYRYVDEMSGVTGRLYRSSSTSAPRTIVLP